MADAAYRGFQHGTAPSYYHQQHSQTFQHNQRHLPRNGSPVSGSRGDYMNDTPSPSRSPVSQASSHNHYSMYNQGQQQGPHVIMNGNHHQRYMPQGGGHKYQHQSYQQQHGQAHHHQQNHMGNHGLGHQHTFSSGTMSNATPHFTPNTLHNGNSSNGQIGLKDGYIPSQHWQQQLQLASESRQMAPHHHCKKDGVIARRQKIVDQGPLEDDLEAGGEERNRAMPVSDTSRQDWIALDLSGQGLRALSSRLEHYSFLTKLYLDHNSLGRIDPLICRLRKLTHLDVSRNGILEIPPEIGMLVNLRELSVIDNGLRTLPPEMGHLFKLDMLAIEGNPLEEDIKDRIMHFGTKALITYFREEYPQDFGPPISPGPRRNIAISDSEAPRERLDSLSVVSYNILCDKYATKSQYGYTSTADLDWHFRKGLILKELKEYDADIICLQEVDRENYEEYFSKELRATDYRGVFWPKSRARTMVEKDARLVDGCATFYRSSKYILLDRLFIDFANNAINRPDMKGEHDTFNRVMPRDNIAVVAFVEDRTTGSRMIVVNAHLYWDPAFADVKLIQVAIMMEQITKQAEKWARHPPCTEKTPFRHSDVEGELNGDSVDEVPVEPGPSLEYARGPDIPLIICGDFNSAAGTGVYDLITKGSVPGDHADLGNRGYGNFTREGMAHPFKLQSAYTSEDELAFTNYTPNFKGVIDYIWYSVNALEVRELLGDVDPLYLSRCPGFPNHFFPSDHLALRAEFGVK